MSYSDSIDIECSPEAAFAVVSDLPHMDRLSLENTGGEWIGGAVGPKVGAKFKGTNARDKDSWYTIAKVLAYDPPRRFAFKVTFKMFNIARWEFAIEPAPGGCRVTETWTDRRNALVRKQGDADGFVRAEFTKQSIRTTLERLKNLCEHFDQ
jgi:Polyketide cyclase / dehydrase and lipid transport